MKNRIIYFGSYHPKYSRNLLTKKAFTNLGFIVFDCQDSNGGLSHYIRLIKKYLKIHQNADFIFIGVLGHYDIPLAWILAKIFRKKIIFDCFYSLYDTYINDRKTTNMYSLNALRFYFYDWIAVKLADKVILDTQENIDYITEKYKVRRNKFYELPVTADPDIFKFNPPKKHKIFTVGFYGSFMPLHGVETIIEAANALKKDNIKFLLTGDGPGLREIINKTKKLYLEKIVNIDSGQISYEQLPKFLNKLDLFLAGPFGESIKAKKVLTAKTVEALSVGVPTIVAENPSTKRLLKNYSGNIYWVKQNDANDLSKTIKNYFNSKNHDKKVNHFLKSELSFNKFQNNLKNILA